MRESFFGSANFVIIAILMAQQKWAKLEDLAESQITPMLRQFIEAKADSNDSLLFFRMGDFYELFFEDALSCHLEFASS